MHIISKYYIILFFIPFNLFSQKQGNVWYFGNYAGVDFNGGTPVALTNGQLTWPAGQQHIEGTSAISDSSGAILFYSNGMTVWDKSHQIMQNGTGLLGSFSTTQSSIIVPRPFSDTYFYLFTVAGGCCPNNISDGFRYSAIDMCANGGLGEVVTTEKNIKLIDSITEKVAATRHSNGTDYWILTHTKYNKFYAFQLSTSGITNTVVSSIGSNHPAAGQGQLKISPNGQKIAIGSSSTPGLLELFDFDKTTGIVSNPISLNRMYNGNIYGVEFSPNNSILYTFSWSYSSPLGMYISQYDISSGNPTIINASLNLILSIPNIVNGHGMQIANNGKIYLTSFADNYSLASINNPNTYGLGCNFQDPSVSLLGNSGFSSLPSFISNYDYSNKMANSCATAINSIDKSEIKTLVYPNPNSGSFKVQIDSRINNVEIIIINSIGQKVFEQKISNGENKINTDFLANGLYNYIILSDKKQISNGKLMIE